MTGVQAGTGLGCYGLGAVGSGHKHPRLDMVRCRRCGKKLKGRQNPSWFGSANSARRWEEGGAECTDCLQARHRGCPCRYVERVIDPAA